MGHAETISLKIKTLMEEKNLNTHQLEQKAGLRSHSVRNILLGRSKNPSIDILSAISEILGCTIDELVHPDSASPKKVVRPEIEVENLTLFNQCVEISMYLCTKYEFTPKIDALFFLIQSLYEYSLENEIDTVDERFAKWFFTKNFQDS
jgi:transcriptional regulator with XRE-family HTH domain